MLFTFMRFNGHAVKTQWNIVERDSWLQWRTQKTSVGDTKVLSLFCGVTKDFYLEWRKYEHTRGGHGVCPRKTFAKCRPKILIFLHSERNLIKYKTKSMNLFELEAMDHIRHEVTASLIVLRTRKGMMRSDCLLQSFPKSTLGTPLLVGRLPCCSVVDIQLNSDNIAKYVEDTPKVSTF